MRLLLAALFMMLWQGAAHADVNGYLEPYDRLLKAHVSTGELKNIELTKVDYKAWSQDADHAAALKALTSSDPSGLSGNEAMTYWINAYNLLTIDLIIKNDERESIRNLGSLLVNPWKKHKWSISGKEYTLDQIEHKILRPMGDARIHVAINCASISCPDLRAEAYTTEKLDVQLDEQSRLFLQNRKKGYSIDGNKLTVSKIFDWFEEDYKEPAGVLGYIRTYDETIPADAEIDGYLDYNWKLNGTW